MKGCWASGWSFVLPGQCKTIAARCKLSTLSVALKPKMRRDCGLRILRHISLYQDDGLVQKLKLLAWKCPSQLQPHFLIPYVCV